MQRDNYLTVLKFLKERHMSHRMLKPSKLGMGFNELNQTAYYLQEHGLASFKGIIESQDPVTHIELIGGDVDSQLSGTITIKGYDYLEEDGGLTSELNIQVIRLHADTIRDLIDAKIVASTAISEHEKPALRVALKGMKEESLKQLATRLISYGLDQGAITVQQLSVWLNL